MPKIATSVRCCSAAARRAAYMSPLASPAESSSDMRGMRSVGGWQRRRQRRCASRCMRDVYRAGQMELLFLVLQLVQAVVDAAFGEQLLMRALLAEPALVEDKDAVGVLNGAEAMRDDQSGTTAE